MESEHDVNLLKDCYFQASDGSNWVDKEVEDGALVKICEPREHDLYANTKDLNARNCRAFEAADEGKCILGFVDYVGVSHADVMGVNYRIGDKIAGVYPNAGEGARVRMIKLGDEFYLGNENFFGNPAVGLYAVPRDGATQVEATATPVYGAGKLCLAIEDERNLIMGQVNEGSKLYRCRVISC